MGEFLGDLERLAADLYPYRWPILVGLLVVLAAVAAYAYRRGWHTWAWERRLAVAAVGTPLLVVAVVAGYYLGSPLFTNVEVDEALPAAFSGAIPAGTQTDQTGSAEVAAPAPLSLVTPRPVASSPEPSPAAGPSPELTATPAPPPTPGVAPLPTPKPLTAGPIRLKVGEFKDQDSFHKGSGTATIFRGPDGSHLLRLEDFKVTNGPDLHVILTPHESPARRDDVAAPGFADLGKLKGNEGNQNYPIPAEVDVAIQRSVVIYCQPFHVIFSVAAVRDEG